MRSLDEAFPRARVVIAAVTAILVTLGSACHVQDRPAAGVGRDAAARRPVRRAREAAPARTARDVPAGEGVDPAYLPILRGLIDQDDPNRWGDVAPDPRIRDELLSRLLDVAVREHDAAMTDLALRAALAPLAYSVARDGPMALKDIADGRTPLDLVAREPLRGSRPLQERARTLAAEYWDEDVNRTRSDAFRQLSMNWLCRRTTGVGPGGIKLCVAALGGGCVWITDAGKGPLRIMWLEPAGHALEVFTESWLDPLVWRFRLELDTNEPGHATMTALRYTGEPVGWRGDCRRGGGLVGTPEDLRHWLQSPPPR